MATTNQEVDFREKVKDEIIFPTSLLDTAIEYIKNNLGVNDVFDEKEIFDWTKDHGEVDEVFEDKDLEAWAINNGFLPKGADPEDLFTEEQLETWATKHGWVNEN